MKPTQVPNRLSNPPPRRVLPIQTPELHFRGGMGQLCQTPHPPGSIHSLGFVSSSPHNVGSPANVHYFMPKDRLGPPEHFAQPQALVSSNPVNIGISSNAPQPISGDQQPGSFGTFRLPVAINQPPSFHIGRDQVIESKAASSLAGSKTVTTQRQESNKAQSSDVGYSIPTVQLHRPSVSVTTPPFNSRAPSEVHPQFPSHSECWYPDISQWPLQGCQFPPKIHSSSSSRLPIMHSFVAPCQSQQQEQTPSNEKLIPAVDLNCSSHKRRSEYEYGSENPKKPCPQGANTDKMETTKPAVCTALVPQSSVKHSSVSENQQKTSDGYLHAEQAYGQSASSELSSAVRPSQPWCKSSSHKECTRKTASTGAKQAFINFSLNHIVQLKEIRPLTANDESMKKTSEEKNKKDKSSTLLAFEVPQTDTSSSTHAELGSHHSGHSASSSSILPVRTPSRSNHVGEKRKLSSSIHKSISKPSSGSLSGRTGERSKTRSRRPVVSYDTNELFTPDPVTYVVSPSNKTAKPKMDRESNKTPEKGSSIKATSSSTSVPESSCEKPQHSKVTGASSSVPNTLSSFPTVTLTRVKLENLITPSVKDKDPKNRPNPSSCRQLKDNQNPSLLCSKVSSAATETDSAVTEQTSTSSCPSLPVEGETGEGDKKHLNEEDSLDVELDLGLSFAVDMDLTQSSHSSEDEQLLSLQEMMERATKPPDTPEKGTFSDPSTPRRPSCQSKTQPFSSTTKSVTYKNNLDQILKEINSNKKSKEIERKLLTACEEDLLKIAEYEEAEENREEGISTEQQEFLQRYSLMSAAIKEVPPGEEVFSLEKFGQIFNQDTLQLRQCMVNPQGTAQKTLLWSSPAQLRLHVNIGLFQEAYDSSAPCPAQVARFLFKMMSVHSERMISEKLLQALCDIALTAAYQIVKYGSQQFKVWVPSLPDVTLVLMNMGVPFVKLFPFENMQPPFTEGDLLEDVYVKSDSPPVNKEEVIFPEHNCSNILKYLSYCMGLCPRAYSDNELLLLLTVMSHIGLETRLILESSVALEPLLCKIVNNIRDWDTLLPEMCLALTDLTDDHHNMCLLVHLLPDNIRGKELRRHLSLCMISKLLDGDCKYRPEEREFQLSRLRPYLPRMQPSSLREMMCPSGRNQKDKEDDLGTLDQQSYYLCYSLLTLANEASNFQFFPAHQKKQLLILSTQLETHVKCDIRESEKCLYRSKVKDLVARIYTKWQMLLQRTRPLDDKLYDYWQPVDTLGSPQEEQEDEDDTAEKGTVVEDEEEEEGETTVTEENETVMVTDKEKEDARVEPEEDMNLGEKLGEVEEGNIPNDTSKTEEGKEPVPADLREAPEMDPQVLKESEAVHVQMDAHNMEHVDEDTETEAREAAYLAPTADLVE